MSTPTSNSTPITFVSATGSYRVDALLDGEKWGGPMGTGVTLDYSFPGIGSSWVHGYESGEPNSPAFAGLSSNQITAVQGALAAWAAVANVSFVQVPDSATEVGDIRVAWSALKGDPQAYTYMPSPDPSAGDIWLNTLAPWDGFNSGDYGYLTLIHELGHALGLKHPFDWGGVNNTLLPPNEDYVAFSIMAYDAYPGDSYAYVNFQPTTPMLDDVLAIQKLYGANMSYHAGDDTYVFDQNSQYYQTLWDAGGNDTIQYDATQGGLIDLRAGHFSHLGQPIEVTLGSGATVMQANTVAIAYGVTIENAIGGSGNDTIYGNSANNNIDGGAGADYMAGGAGNDTYTVDNVGDRVVELPGQGNDSVLTSLAKYSLSANVENLTFTGNGDFSGYGNALNNVIQGGNGNDYINGGAGADTMVGGSGNDTYVVDNKADHVVEMSNGGIDAVLTALSSYTLPDNVENLHHTGAGNFSGYGNSLDNTIIGGPGNDTLVGGAGNDTLDGGAGHNLLTGGTGNDVFLLDALINPSHNLDRIVDFQSGGDQLDLKASIYAAIQWNPDGSLPQTEFLVNVGVPHVTDPAVHLAYDAGSGNVYYTQSVHGIEHETLALTLIGHPDVTATDFHVI